jgi:phosphopantothenoylcysteine decarboxylase/phosphopantothenate--cysteine ligase
MGYALAVAAKSRGWDVEVVSGPVSLPIPTGVVVTRVVSAEEMLAAVAKRFDACDIFTASRPTPRTSAACWASSSPAGR